MAYLTYLKELKKERNLSSSDIAEISNIPAATVSRILSGTTPNPTFETISAITLAMGGSLDKMVGIRSLDETPLKPQVETTLVAYADLLNEKDARIKEKEESIRQLKQELRTATKWKTALALTVFILLVAVIAFLVVDITNGHFGYFRY